MSIIPMDIHHTIFNQHLLSLILVNPSHPGNIGGAARAMKNMGLNSLALVNPKRFPDQEATARASGADDVLSQAKVFSHLNEAISKCTLVMGTSARDRRLTLPTLTPEAAAKYLLKHLKSGLNACILFGREDSGLTNEELQLCQFHIHIPTNPDFSSLNLAAAVQLISYEIRREFLSQQLTQKNLTNKYQSDALPLDDLMVNAEQMEYFYQHLEATLIHLGFLNPDKPRLLMPRLRRLFNRAAPSLQEMNILRGILAATQNSQVDQKLNHG